MKSPAISTLLLLGWLTSPATAFGQDVDGVALDADDLAAEIQAANDNGPARDTISLSADILLTPEVTLPAVSSAITLEGRGFRIARVLPEPSLPPNDEVNCNPDLENAGLLQVTAEGALTLNDALLEHACADTGGGLTISGGLAVVSGCTFRGNVSRYDGGGIMVDQGTLHLTDSVMIGNVSTQLEGGGIKARSFAQRSNVIVRRSSFQQNRAAVRGGAIANGGDMQIFDSLFGGDVAEDGNVSIQGAAIHNYGELHVENSPFEHNQAESSWSLAPGGAVQNHSTITLVGCSLARNTGYYEGAALVNIRGAMRLIDTTVTENETQRGAGLFNRGLGGDSVVEIIDSRFTSNVAGQGGAINNGDRGMVTVVGSTLLGNQATEAAAIFNEARGVTSRVVVESSLIADNSAQYVGGVVSIASSTQDFGHAELAFNNTTFSNNTSEQGGAVMSTAQINSFSYASVTVTNSAFIANTSTAGSGPALWLQGYGVESGVVSNCTFVDNHAVGSGGAILAERDAALSLVHSTFWNNTSDNGAGALQTTADLTARNTLIAHDGGGLNCAGPIVGANNLSDDTSCGDAFSQTDALNLTPLADNGGLPPTIALGADSSAIGAADDVACRDAPVGGLDQRGVSRGAECDIGAYESDARPFATPTVAFVTASSNPAEGEEQAIPIELVVPDGVVLGGDVIVQVIPGPGTTTAEDYGPLMDTPITFAGPLANTQVVLTVPVLDDGQAEADEHVELLLSVTGPAALGPIATHRMTIGCGDADDRCPEGLACIANACNPRGAAGDACDPGDSDDCTPGHACDPDGTCRLSEGVAGCQDNDALCALDLVCIDDHCAPPSQTGGSCLTTDDCAEGHACLEGLCLLDDDQLCEADEDCVNICDHTQQPARCAPNLPPMPDAGSDADMDVGSDAEPDADATPDATPDTDTIPDAEPNPDAAPDTDAEPDTDTIPDAEPDAVQDPDTTPDADPDTAPDAEPDTLQEPDAAVDANPDTTGDVAPDATPDTSPTQDASPDSATPDTAQDLDVALDTNRDSAPDGQGAGDAPQPGSDSGGCAVSPHRRTPGQGAALLFLLAFILSRRRL